MIRINKSPHVPRILLTTGQQETTIIERAYSANPQNYTSGLGVSQRNIVKFDFINSIYGDSSVKTQLK